jgi:hypothetical protein
MLIAAEKQLLKTRNLINHKILYKQHSSHTVIIDQDLIDDLNEQLKGVEDDVLFVKEQQELYYLRSKQQHSTNQTKVKLRLHWENMSFRINFD